jgi:ABC-type Fe3+ transport system substrate-binding protein
MMDIGWAAIPWRVLAAGRLAQHRAELVVPYVPPKPATLPPWADWLVNTSVAALLGLIGWGVYELLLR